MDRKKILDDLITSYRAYSISDSRPTIEKILIVNSQTFDIRERGDIKTEVAVFKLLGGNTTYLLDENKPDELEQNWQILVYVEQGDKHSTKDARYERMLELTDQIVDWSLETSAHTVNTDLWDIVFTGVTPIDEEDGFLSTEVNLKSVIKLS